MAPQEPNFTHSAAIVIQLAQSYREGERGRGHAAARQKRT